jgi:hypothetical protein
VHSDAQPATCAPGDAAIGIWLVWQQNLVTCALGIEKDGSKCRLFLLVDAEVLLAAIVPVVVEFYQVAGVADKAVEPRVVLNGVADVRRVGTASSVIALSPIVRCIVRCGGHSGGGADSGCTCELGAIHSVPRLSTCNTSSAHGR